MNEKLSSVIRMDEFKAEAKKKGEEKSSELFQGFVTKIPPIPKGIDKEARKHWKYVGKRLADANMLCEVDLGQFQILCQTWSLYLKAQAECDDKEEFQTTPNSYSQLAPWAIARERHANRYQKIADKFFLSPRARKSVDIKNPSQGSLDLD